MMEKKIGKIRDLEYGWGGYDGAMLGVTFHLGGQGWGVTDFWGYW